jgi:hypothetical protein
MNMDDEAGNRKEELESSSLQKAKPCLTKASSQIPGIMHRNIVTMLEP